MSADQYKLLIVFLIFIVGMGFSIKSYLKDAKEIDIFIQKVSDVLDRSYLPWFSGWNDPRLLLIRKDGDIELRVVHHKNCGKCARRMEHLKHSLKLNGVKHRSTSKCLIFGPPQNEESLEGYLERVLSVKISQWCDVEISDLLK